MRFEKVIKTEKALMKDLFSQEIRSRLRKTIGPDELESKVTECMDFMQKYRTVLLDTAVSLYIETSRIEKAARNMVLYFDREKKRESLNNRRGNEPEAKSPLQQVSGKWPGDEPIEEILDILNQDKKG